MNFSSALCIKYEFIQEAADMGKYWVVTEREFQNAVEDMQ